MGTVYMPSEDDIRRWVKEAVREYLDGLQETKTSAGAEIPEELLNRKEIAAIFRISLVTLNDWTKRGLPSHKQGGRVYFIKSEIMDYVKRNGTHRRSKNSPAKKTVKIN